MSKKFIGFVKFPAYVALALLLCACAASKEPSAQEAAVKQWNDARSAVLVGLGSDQYQNANFEKSRATTDEALRLSPDNAMARLLSAKLYIETGSLEAAQCELILATQNATTAAEANYLSGVVYQRWQQPQRALECYQHACDLAPAELAYVLAKAEMLVAMGQRDDALTLLLAKVAYFEHSGEIRDEVGLLYIQEKRYPEAVEMLRRAAILSPDDLTVREHLAIALFDEKQYGEATSLFNNLLASGKCDHRPDIQITLGECQLETDDFGGAVLNFQQASEAMPQSPSAWLGLARAELELGNPRQAEFALRHCLSLENAGGDAHLLMGYVMLREKRLMDAYGEFVKASDLDPKDTVSLCMVGLTLDRLGRLQEAATWYSKALKVNPDDEMAHELMANIDVHE